MSLCLFYMAQRQQRIPGGAPNHQVTPLKKKEALIPSSDTSMLCCIVSTVSFHPPTPLPACSVRADPHHRNCPRSSQSCAALCWEQTDGSGGRGLGRTVEVFGECDIGTVNGGARHVGLHELRVNGSGKREEGSCPIMDLSL